ncbi:PhoH family protein [Natronospirillum operosum]|uniref:PhoH family protein n=1 Tax=Natronospirillum operosum TaxID=2759953 RepID=UPI001F113E6A|nr:PhoH family protein [Natronospirillum operosum]
MASTESPVKPAASTVRFELLPDHPQRLASLCGLGNENLRLIEERLGVRVLSRGNAFEVRGEEPLMPVVQALLVDLYAMTQGGADLQPDQVHLHLQDAEIEARTSGTHPAQPNPWDKPGINEVRTPKVLVKPKGPNQKKYVHAIQTHDVNFGLGPAGTGKTYLAVACAVNAYMRDDVKRILLVRPAVEAGEKLGFLPGDLAQKVDPYLRPLYDALYDMLGFEKVDRLIERNVIEVAPLAYMRGRTLSHAFIILDESQNTTREQMKMFLTRIGFGSTAVITGDPSQVDLPRNMSSGLKHAIEVLEGVEGISFVHFGSQDVVRHPMVQRIVDAYERWDDKQEPERNGR